MSILCILHSLEPSTSEDSLQMVFYFLFLRTYANPNDCGQIALDISLTVLGKIIIWQIIIQQTDQNQQRPQENHPEVIGEETFTMAGKKRNANDWRNANSPYKTEVQLRS